MAAVGAGTTAGFYSPTPSAIFHRQKLKLPAKFKSDGFSKQKFQVVFSRSAFKQGLYEQRLIEREYFNSRLRAERRRCAPDLLQLRSNQGYAALDHPLPELGQRREHADPYKRKSKLIQSLAIWTICVGMLICCCGFMVGWAKSFPLGDISPFMPWMQVIGVAVLLGGVILMSMAHLLYHKNDTMGVHRPTRAIEEPILCKSKSATTCIKTMSDGVFSLGFLALAVSLLAFCIGYISDWASQSPVKITDGQRKVIGVIGIGGMVGSILTMWATDLISAWITFHVERKRVNPMIVIDQAHVCISPISEATIRTPDERRPPYHNQFEMQKLHTILFELEGKQSNPSEEHDIENHKS